MTELATFLTIFAGALLVAASFGLQVWVYEMDDQIHHDSGAALMVLSFGMGVAGIAITVFGFSSWSPQP